MMNKNVRRFISCILSVAMLFTSVFTGSVFAADPDAGNQEKTEAELLEEFIQKYTDEPVATGTEVTYTLEQKSDNSGDKPHTFKPNDEATSTGGIVAETTVKVDKADKEYSLFVDASKFEAGTEGAAEIAAEYDNTASDRIGNGASLKKGTVLYVPVNGLTTFTITNGFNTGKIEVSDVGDDPEYTKEYDISQSAWSYQSPAGDDVLEYAGKSTSVAKLTVTDGNFYIKTIKVNPQGVKDWEKKDFTIKVKDTTIAVTGAATASDAANVNVSDTSGKSKLVGTAEAKEASVVVDNLGKNGLTEGIVTINDSFKDKIETAVAERKITVTFKDATAEPKQFVINIDNVFEKKDFSFDINGVNVNVSGSAVETDAPEITLTSSDAVKVPVVVRKDNSEATIKIPLGGKALSKDLIANVSDNIDVAVNGDDINVTYKNISDTVGNKPWGYTFKVIDADSVTGPEYGKTYSYNFTDGSVIEGGDSNAHTPKFDTFQSTDEILTINKNDGQQFCYWNDHGIVVKDNNTFEIKVPGNSTISIQGCAFSKDTDTVTASVKDGKGTVTPSEATSVKTVACGDSVSFEYKGEAATVVLTVAGSPYIHGVTVVNASAPAEEEDPSEKPNEYGDGKIDVWDFGAYQLDAEKYNNLLTVDIINSWYTDAGVEAGQTGNTFPASFAAGDLSWSGVAKSNRLRVANTAITRYDESNSVGSIKKFDCEALNITGCLYANGSNSSKQGSFSIDLKKDDIVYLYIKMDNSDDVVVFTKAGESVPVAEVAASMEGSVVKFVAPSDGVYKMCDADGGGKPRYYRVTREHARYKNVSGTITAPDTMTIDDGYKIVIKNTETGKEYKIKLKNKSYSCYLPIGYKYQAVLVKEGEYKYVISKGNSIDLTSSKQPVEFDGIYGDVDGDSLLTAVDAALVLTKVVDSSIVFTPQQEIAADVDGSGVVLVNDASLILQRVLNASTKFDVESKPGGDVVEESYNIEISEAKYNTYTGSVTGFAGDYDRKDSAVFVYVPVNEDDKGMYGEAEVAVENGEFSVALADKIEYKLELKGADDYDIVKGGSVISGQDNALTEIAVKAKSLYEFTGNFVSLTGENVAVTGITFNLMNKDKNDKDIYSYKGTVNGNEYSVSLRDGVYEVAVEGVSGYTQATHIVVDGKGGSKDVVFKSTANVETPYVSEVYVDKTDGANHYKTLKEALEAVNTMPGTEPITIHIAPGTYRAQHILKRANVSLINTNPEEEVLLTWYYGIGYKYYSADKTGYYNELSARDKYLKNGSAEEKVADVSKWGGAFYIQGTATDFYAENITFENSFNKYVTEEEIADGVTFDQAQSIKYDRTKADADVRSKAATERAAAVLAEGDRAEFYKCRFSSSQDTLYIDQLTHQYYKDCFVEGMTDYIFGDGEIVFDNCTLNFCGYSSGAQGGYVTATRHEQGGKGYLFNNCKVTGTNSGGITAPVGFLGRPWGQDSVIVWLNLVIEDSLINSDGYTSMTITPDKAHYSQYNLKDKDGKPYAKLKYGTVLTEEQANAIKMVDYFGGWTPKKYTAQ